jgi:hypothetical protein
VIVLAMSGRVPVFAPMSSVTDAVPSGSTCVWAEYLELTTRKMQLGSAFLTLTVYVCGAPVGV